jgi:hypothetical protein
MAKPRAPKKASNDPSLTPAETTTVASAVEVKSVEIKSAEPVSSEPQMAVKKPTIVRSEPRANQAPKNLVPINLEEEIRRLAYLLSERRGFAPGHEAEDWLTAENEILQRYHQQSA